MACRFGNFMKDLKNPGADIDPDHNLLVSMICMRLKEIIQFANEIEGNHTVCEKVHKGGIWRSYMLNKIKCKILWKKNSVQ